MQITAYNEGKAEWNSALLGGLAGRFKILLELFLQIEFLDPIHMFGSFVRALVVSATKSTRSLEPTLFIGSRIAGL